MFIEKIPIENKMAYLQKIVDQFNTNYSIRDNEYLRPLDYSDHAIEIMKQNGAQEKIADLIKRNIFCGVYENYMQHGLSLYAYQYAMIVAFGDTSVKTTKAPLGRRPVGKSYYGVLSDDDYVLMDMTKAFDYLDKHQAELEHQNPLVTNAAYIKEFMLPNLRTIDEEQCTHLVADYKVAVANKFEKKKHLILQNLQKQQDDLFGNELSLEK